MKNFLLLSLFCAISFNISSQVVTGVYKGKMEVDSPKYTVDFELTLKEKNGKLFGYCHRLFIVEDVLYYNLVKVTARIADSVLIVEDEKSVSNNFKENTTGVKTVMFFTIQKDNDTVSVMPGEWSTSRTKKFLPITGKISVSREQNYLSTQLYKRLEDKQLDKEMAFEEKTKPQPVIAAATTKQQPNEKTETKPVVQKPTEQVKVDTKQTVAGKIGNETKQQNNQPSVAANNPKQNLPAAPVVNKPNVLPAADSSKIIGGKIGNETKQQNNQPSVAANNPKQNLPTAPVVNKPNVLPAADSSKIIAGKIGNETKQQNIQSSIAANNPKQNLPTAPVVNKPNVMPAVNSSKVNAGKIGNETKQQTNQPSVAANNPKQNLPTGPVVTKPTVMPMKDSTKIVAVNQNIPQVTTQNKPTVTSPVFEKPIADINKVNESTNTTAADKPYVPAPLPVISNPTIVKRVTEIIQTVEIIEDSVVLSLYDNGEIDGDTVSVFVNNELVVSKVGLSAKAFKKTIYFKRGEIIQLTFYAENLGSIPPNTGLLVLYTSTERHQIFFSSNYDKSSSILLRRKE